MALDDQHAQSPGHQQPERAAGGADQSSFAGAALLTGDQLLPCGRPLSHVWERARDAAPAADPHTAGCLHCRQAIEGLAALDVAIGALRAQERPDPQTLADRVMRVVRAEVRLGRMLPLDDPARDLQIAETAAAKVLRRAADTDAGARVASLRMTPTADGQAVHIALTLAAAPDRPLPDRAEQVRRAVLRAAHQALGMVISSIDVRIVDVLDPTRPAAFDEADSREGKLS
ncbi:hypothetical protein ABZ532_21950 [Streptomyces sp. NPDC019396]|uniref:hypothetical protein n=1 Tax=Streptomyces sp. NPDC019396 TaxID=3154687 RepID=UPI0033EC0C29